MDVLGNTIFLVDARTRTEDEMPVGAMPVVEIPLGSVGTIFRVRFVKQDGTADDISGGSSILFNARTKQPNAVQVTGDAAASYTNDGSDGYAEYVLTSAEADTERELIVDIEVADHPDGPKICERVLMRITPRAKV